MASTYLSVSTTSSGTRTKWTTSFWVKRCSTGAEHTIFGSYLDSNNKDKIAFDSSDRLQFASVQAGGYSNGGNLVTNRVFRDTNAWYHIVLRWDTNNSTADDRMKIWVNGVEETSFSSRTNPTSGRESLINYTTYTKVGNNGSSGNYLDGVLSHIHFCDNYTYSASDFGETDSTTGEWKIKTEPSVSYGTNGFFVLKDGNSLTDQSPNTNNLTVSSGTLTKTEDCPSNVFATWNPLDNYYASSTFSSGNTALNSGGTSIETWNTSTLAASSGKYYFELKHNGGSATPYRQLVGITQSPTTSASAQLGSTSTSWGYYDNTGYVRNNNSNISWSGNTWTQNDIIGVAMDLDNNRLFFSKNGTWQNSADPTTSTGAITITAGTYFFAWGDATTHSSYCQANFGNGYFGTTAVSSAGTNASGNGIFEYDVPTGYTALSTKGLNE